MTPLQSVESARPKLYDLAARLTSDRDLREDLVSEMTLFLLERWDELRDKPDAFIFRACYRHAIDVLRRGKSVDSKQRSGVVVESLCALCERLGVDECVFACSVNGEQVPLSIATFLLRNRTFLPLRELGTALGKEVRWEKGTLLMETPKR